MWHVLYYMLSFMYSLSLNFGVSVVSRCVENHINELATCSLNNKYNLFAVGIRADFILGASSVQATHFAGLSIHVYFRQTSS